tara:strand:- start:78 stop:509 length:432 start_codon:yes stop_codon:yes gene_type:complete
MSIFSKAVSGVAGFLFGDTAAAATREYFDEDTFGSRLATNLAEGFIGSSMDSETGKSKAYEPYVPMQQQTKVSGRSGVDAGTYRSSKIDPNKIGQVDRVVQKGRIAQQSNLPKIQAHVEYITPRTSSGRRTQTLEGSSLKLRK